MLTYTVHEPSDPPADRIDRAERLVFIKEGFTWSAAFFGPLWLLAHRLWWALLGWGVLALGLQAAQKAAFVSETTAGFVALGINLLLGFEADSLRRWTLQRRGWRMLGTVSGRNAEECERRFFENWLPSQPIITPSRDDASSGGRRWPVLGSLMGARS